MTILLSRITWTDWPTCEVTRTPCSVDDLRSGDTFEVCVSKENGETLADVLSWPDFSAPNAQSEGCELCGEPATMTACDLVEMAPLPADENKTFKVRRRHQRCARHPRETLTFYHDGRIYSSSDKEAEVAMYDEAMEARA